MANLTNTVRFVVVLSLACLIFPAATFAHGGEDMSKQPARALAQQALALITETDNLAEAKERADAAIKSKDKKDVNTAALRKAGKALGKQDKAEAVKQLEASLTAPKPADETDKEKEGAGDEEDHEEGDEHGDEEHGDGDEEMDMDEQAQTPSKEALHKEGRQFKPLHTTEDTVGAIVGGVLVLLGIGGLLLGRRRST